ncbi:MAG: rRNA pseudouridine synthase [Holosporales bacterium]|jgi:23S rRNA pseudouridine2605 synthase|nr:rRNA pseudouridine synthase [Holosporales bacterium]
MKGAPSHRIAKVMARAGVCSRREAERLVAAGRVAIDGTTVTTPAVTITPEQHVSLDGCRIPSPLLPRLWCFHKPIGVITTHYDPQGRKTVFEMLAQQELPRVISVGRLDVTSEGLLLLTNHGGLARALELPATGLLRCYRARVLGVVTQSALKQLQQGLTVQGVLYGSVEATLERQKGSNAWLKIALKEGKNREIRKLAEHFGWKVNRLIRTAYGPFHLGSLPVGSVQEVPSEVWRQQLSELEFEG